MAFKPSQSVECIPSPERIGGMYENTQVSFATGAVSSQADYFVFYNAAGTSYAIWLDKDAADVAPTGAAYVAATNKIEVNILTADTAIQVAGKVYTAINGNIASVSVSDNGDGSLKLLQSSLGDALSGAPHNADDSGAGSISLTTLIHGSANYEGATLSPGVSNEPSVIACPV